MAVRKKHIQMLVERLLAAQGVSSAPVPVEKLAEACGATIKRQPAEDSLSGFLLRDRAGTLAVIGVNSTHHANRQRFTVAHELGHLLLHPPEAVHVDREEQAFDLKLRSRESSDGTDPEEIESNMFAAELLMPTSFIQNDFHKYRGLDLMDPKTEQVLEELASRYEVSTQALTYRVVKLGLL